MVDPINFTNYNRDIKELEETLLFSLLVAGKNALTTSRLLDEFLKNYSFSPTDSPFEVFRRFNLDQSPRLSVALRDFGFGCYNAKAKGIYQMIWAGLNLRICTTDDLEVIHGIGMKTSRLFILHTRKDADCIPLDVHILHFLRDLGYDVPAVTPGSKSKYLAIESICKKLARQANVSLAEWDLGIWRIYREIAANRRKAS